jgi:hypothetical protein
MFHYDPNNPCLLSRNVDAKFKEIQDKYMADIYDSYFKANKYHCFSLTGEYTARDTITNIAEHTYYLHQKQWFYRGAYGTNNLPLNKVPQQFRMYLFINGIDQPME